LLKRPRTGDPKPAPKTRRPKFPTYVKRLRKYARGKLQSSVFGLPSPVLKQILLNKYKSTMQFSKHIILASKSPRRSQLLKEAGIPFTVKAKEVDESFPEDLASEEVAAFIAKKKAEASLDLIGPNDILLTADSIVLLDDVIYEKPKDYDDAIRILTKLSGSVHQVITGVCMRSLEKEVIFSSVAHVHIEALSAEEIEYYIKNFEPYDKAGSYAIQEWIGLCKISKIEGTYTNIMGLPVDVVYKELVAWDADR